MRRPQDNPFRVDRVTALPFIGKDLARLSRRFESLDCRAAIVGGEGSGKSTLMQAIGSSLAAEGTQVIVVGLPASASNSAKQAAARQAARAADSAIVLFDGFEQLGLWHRRRVLRCPRLVITAHAVTGIATLTRLRPRWSTFERLLNALMCEVLPGTRAFALARFEAYDGDARQTFFDLYDAWAGGRIDGVACSAENDTAISIAEP